MQASGDAGAAGGSHAGEYVLGMRTLQGSNGAAHAGPRVLQHFWEGLGGDVPGSEQIYGLRADCAVR